jgi:hypothetical protein
VLGHAHEIHERCRTVPVPEVPITHPKVVGHARPGRIPRLEETHTGAYGFVNDWKNAFIAAGLMVLP